MSGLPASFLSRFETVATSSERLSQPESNEIADAMNRLQTKVVRTRRCRRHCEKSLCQARLLGANENSHRRGSMPSGMSLIKFPRSKQRKPKNKKCPPNRDDDFLAAAGREYRDEFAPEKALASPSPNESPRDLPFFV